MCPEQLGKKAEEGSGKVIEQLIPKDAPETFVKLTNEAEHAVEGR